MSDYDTQTTSNIGYGYDEPFPVKNIPYYGYNEETDTSTDAQNYIPMDNCKRNKFIKFIEDKLK